MPIYQMSPFDFDVSRRAILLDTNVLVAAFCPEDSKHDDTRTFLELVDNQLIVPISVVIETWGMLVGSYRSWDWGLNFLVWLSNPGNAILVPQHIESSDVALKMTSDVRVDAVDAFLMYLADDLSGQCDLKPPILIATYDSSDFVRCLESHRLRFGILYPDTLEEYFLKPPTTTIKKRRKKKAGKKK